MKLRYLLYIGVLAYIFTGCKKDNKEDDHDVILENSTWVVTTTDDNPGTNPSGSFGMDGTNLYYPWGECHLDDIFTFSNNKCTIEDNGTACEDGQDLLFETKVQSYSYSASKKQLMIGSDEDIVILDVYELNKDRMKLGLPIFTGNIIFLFKRK